MSRLELSPQYDCRQSFYGKAEIEDLGQEICLYSYGTLAATFNKVTKEPTVYNLCSATTVRHVKEFFKQQGLFIKDKKQLEGWYVHS